MEKMINFSKKKVIVDIFIIVPSAGVLLSGITKIIGI